MAISATIRVAAVAAIILILGWVVRAMTDERSQDALASQASPPQQVSARLLGPAEAIAGIQVPEGLADQSTTYLHALTPADVTVRLPGDRTVRMWSKLTSVNVDHGVVLDVYLLPLPKGVPFREAVAELRRLMHAMHIEPDERMRKQMAAWPDDSGPLTYRTRVDLDDSSALEVDVRGTPDGAGFYLALTFAASVKARRVAEATTKLAALPTDRHPSGSARPRGRDEPRVETGGGIAGVATPLLGPTRQVQGMHLHQAVPELCGYVSELLRPHRLTIRLPDGGTLILPVRGMALLSEYGVVEGVYVRRPLGPVSLTQAVADVHHTIKDLAIEPDEAMRRQMAAWPKDEPAAVAATATHDILAGMPLGEQARLDVHLRPDPRGGWYYLLAVEGTPLACAAAQAVERLATLPDRGRRFSRRSGEPGETGGGDRRPEVWVPLLGPTEQARGMDMDQIVPVLPLAWPDLLRPCRLTVHLPDGRAPTLEARGVALLSDHGTVVDVFARIPSQPVPFREAVADLRRALGSVGIEPDEAMRRQMAAWPADAPATITADELPDVQAGMSLGKGARLDVRICPDPRGGWYSLLRLGATAQARATIDDARRAVRDPAPAAGARPPAEGKGEAPGQGSGNQ